MGKFDITAAFQAAVGSVSKSDTERESIEYIGLDKLEADPSNFYAVAGLEELAAELLEEQILIKDLTEKIANGRQYVRIAVRSRRENEQLVEALKINILHRLGGQE